MHGTCGFAGRGGGSSHRERRDHTVGKWGASANVWGFGAPVVRQISNNRTLQFEPACSRKPPRTFYERDRAPRGRAARARRQRHAAARASGSARTSGTCFFRRNGDDEQNARPQRLGVGPLALWSQVGVADDIRDWHWARYQFCRIYFKIYRRGAPAKILKKFAVGPDFHQDLSHLRCGVGGWVRLGLLGLEG